MGPFDIVGSIGQIGFFGVIFLGVTFFEQFRGVKLFSAILLLFLAISFYVPILGIFFEKFTGGT